ncbi:MAG: hypothetical protein C0501_19665 [Isosphaera sp.]|nr:hypothetical protein [Isosphaera sp.]
MRIDGHWLVCRDDLLRPVISYEVRAADGAWHEVPFLVDTGADSTSLTAEALLLLGLEPVSPEGVRVEGVGGSAPSVVVKTALRLATAGGAPVVMPAELIAFTEPGPLELSYLGRNVTNKFAVVVDRPGDTVCLLHGNHRCVIQEA